MQTGNTPFFRRQGTQVARGEATPPSKNPPFTNRNNERDLNLQFTPLKVLNVYGRQIPVCNITIGAESLAWYGLASWKIGRDIPPAHWNGYRFELGGTNKNGAVDGVFTDAPGDQTKWGTGDGYGAAVVLGVNMPWVTQGQWSNGPNDVPFVNEGALFRQGGERESFVLHFAAGDAKDAPKPFVSRTNITTPMSVLLTEGMTLTAAFVGKGPEVTVPSTYGLIMRVYGEMYLSALRADREVPQ